LTISIAALDESSIGWNWPKPRAESREILDLLRANFARVSKRLDCVDLQLDASTTRIGAISRGWVLLAVLLWAGPAHGAPVDISSKI
jgi:hypothetical protein